MNISRNLLESPDLTLASYTKEGKVREFHLVAGPVKRHILPGVLIDGMGYNGSIPGPLMVCRVGDLLRVTLDNNLGEPTALHFYGMDAPTDMAGVPEVDDSPRIDPGDRFTYEFVVKEKGTFFYQSSVGYQSQLGMLGPVVSLPEEGVELPDYGLPDHGVLMVLQEWCLPQARRGEIEEGVFKPDPLGDRPNFFTINGRAYPATSPIKIKPGEWIRFRFVNQSQGTYSMHLHGHNFRIAAVDGFPPTGPAFLDTISIHPGNRWEVDFPADNPGKWLLSPANPMHRTNNGVIPGGMMTVVEYAGVEVGLGGIQGIQRL